MSSAANHRKRSHRSQHRHNYRRIAPITPAPALRSSFSLSSLLRSRMNAKRIATNNAAKARLDTPAD